MPENQSRRLLAPIAGGVALIAVAAAFLVGLGLHDDPAPATADPSVRGVVTTGTASVDGAPDQLGFTASVSNSAEDTRTAMDRTSAGVKAVIAALKGAGVAAKDIRTANINVEPNYTYSSGQTRITGYRSSSSLRILVRDLRSAGKVISAAASASGNSVSVRNVSMSMSNRSALVADARAKAVKVSRAAAAELAVAAGRKVDELLYVEEVTAGRDSSDLYLGDFARAATLDAASANSLVVAPGQQQVGVTVKVRWSLR